MNAGSQGLGSDSHVMPRAGSSARRPRARILTHLLRRSWLTMAFFFIAFCAAVLIADSRTPGALHALVTDFSNLESFEAVIYIKAGIRTALMALIFSALYLLAVKAIGSVYRFIADRCRGRPRLQLLLEFMIYTIFGATALLPISMLMEFEGIRALSADRRALALLCMINGLLFFIGVSYIDLMINESYKTYATSAEFKSATKASMTREASWQFILSRWASIYYFVLTFTMVPEIVVPNTNILFREELGDNIVRSIFQTVFHAPDDVSLLWLQSMAFIATSLVIRLLIDACELFYDLRIGLVARSEA